MEKINFGDISGFPPDIDLEQVKGSFDVFKRHHGEFVDYFLSKYEIEYEINFPFSVFKIGKISKAIYFIDEPCVVGEHTEALHFIIHFIQDHDEKKFQIFTIYEDSSILIHSKDFQMMEGLISNFIRIKKINNIIDENS